MAIDPRLFLGIGGPTPQQQMLPPGFRPPGPGPGAPMMSPPQMQMPQFGIPGMGLMGPRKPDVAGSPSTTGAIMGASENDGLAGAVAGIQGLTPNSDGVWDQPPMPTDIGYGGGGQPGGFSTWWARNFGGLGRLF